MSIECTKSVSLVFCACCIAGHTSVALAGDPTPPPGPVDGTMLRLDEVEPRIPIGPETTPPSADSVFTITQDGQYFLTASLTAQAGSHGIKITADEVTLDLNGFSLTGGPGSLNGINFTPTFEDGRYILKSGLTAGSSGSSITGFGGDGVHIGGAVYVEASGLSLRGNGGDGMDVTFAPKVVPQTAGTYTFELTVTDAFGNGGHGISVTGQSLAAGAQEPADVRVEKFNTRSNAGSGLHTLFDSTADPVVVVVEGSATDNGGDGLHLENVREVAVNGVTADNNVGDGIDLALNTATPGHKYVEEVTLSSMSGNGGHGLIVSGQNLTAGPPGTVTVIVVDDQCSGNGGSGIFTLFDATADPVVVLSNVSADGNGENGVTGAMAGATPFLMDWRARNLGASRNSVDGLQVSGNLDIRGGTFRNNGDDGMDYLSPGEPVEGINISLEQIVGASNGGSGGKFVWTQIDGPFKFDVRSSSFHDNTLDGMTVVGGDNGVLSMSGASATSNGLDGFALDVSNIDVQDSDASRNSGGGFVLTGTNSQDDAVVSTFTWTQASNNGGDGFNGRVDEISMAHCSAIGNGGDGFDFAPGEPVEGINISLEQIVGARNDGHGTLVVQGDLDMNGSVMKNNGGSGVRSDENSSCWIRVSQMRANGSHGLHSTNDVALHVSGGNFSDNGRSGVGDGLHVADLNRDGLLDMAVASGNSGAGVQVLDVGGALRISGMTASNNSATGIQVGSATGIAIPSVEVRDVTVSNNTFAGLLIFDTAVGRVSGSSAFANGGSGIEVLSFSHIITNNYAGGNGGMGDFAALLPGNAIGQVVDETNIITDVHSAANYKPAP